MRGFLSSNFLNLAIDDIDVPGPALDWSVRVMTENICFWDKAVSSLDTRAQDLNVVKSSASNFFSIIQVRISNGIVDLWADGGIFNII